MNELETGLKKAFSMLKSRARLAIILSLLFILGIAYSKYIKAGVFVILFIIIGGISKSYHRIIKSSVGIDLVFFFTVMTSLAYKNILLTLIVGWVGLILADTIGMRFSHTSVISLVGLTFVAIISGPVALLGAHAAAISLTLGFELISGFLYYFMGSSPGRIAAFILSHLLFNLFLILNFAEPLLRLMA